jgi:signal peptidase I
MKRGGILELALIVATAVGLALAVQAWAVKPYEIPSESMEPTLDVGQRVLVNRFGTHLGDPDVGDIVVFHPPVGAAAQKCGINQGPHEPCPQPNDKESDATYIKRVVAGPGDRLQVVHGHPVVNGVPAQETFAVPCRNGPSCNLRSPITIPPDHYFMMGDNRPSSDDSRYWGPVPKEWIIGTAFATYWPPDRVGVF